MGHPVRPIRTARLAQRVRLSDTGWVDFEHRSVRLRCQRPVCPMQVTGSSKTSLRRPRPRCGRSCKVRPVPRPNAGRSGHLWLVARPSRLARCRHADRRAGDLRWRVHGDLRGWPRLRVASVTVGKPDRTDLGPHRDRLDSFRRRMHDHRMLNACRGLAATTSECRRDCWISLGWQRRPERRRPGVR